MASVIAAPRRFRIGVDVGGTNTDGVILDPLESMTGNCIKAWHKSPTTGDPSHGIKNAMSAMFASSSISPEQIVSVTIGTTQFVNAVVERDASKLSKVAVIRLCGPFSKHTPPCVDWPRDMRDLFLGHYALVKGGLEIDGHLISEIDPDEIREQCSVIKRLGITSVVVNGIFSPIDTSERQEERAADIIRGEIADCDVVCSKDIANLGFLERENAAILNASILRFARRTISSFYAGAQQLGLSCPVFVAQNDGTVLSGNKAAQLPIRTFSSGPTNSMRGAAFLAHGQISDVTMVVDIGGTTTDVGLLDTSGFPRQQSAYSELAGIRMNFPSPDIKSVGLGGGSLVRRPVDQELTVGPDSVGYDILKKSVVFGGDVLTATDCAVHLNPDLNLGDVSLIQEFVSEDELKQFEAVVRNKLEGIIDRMKMSPEDLPVILVGGGAVIAPDSLRGASRVIKPQWSQVANAVGAAMARVSALVDIVKSTEARKTDEIEEEVKEMAIERAVANGALLSSVTVVEVEQLPLAYISNKTRFIVRAVGDFDVSKSQTAFTATVDDTADILPAENTVKVAQECRTEEVEVDIATYKPQVKNRVWYVSETDVDWISIGCYILGTGGGGSPYAAAVRLRRHLRKGAVVRIVHPHDLADDAQVGCGGGVGSPTVGIEKLTADEMMDAQVELSKICKEKPTHMIAVEIGGMNGLQAMQLGASPYMNLPAVDGDWMGRAYPTKWQTTPVVFNERTPIWSPIAMSDGNGNVLVMTKASSDHHVERIFRAALSQMGSQVAAAEAPVTGAETKRWVVENTLSQAWRIGRGVVKARKENRTGNVAESIINECGGPGAGKVLWKGKIIGVERKLRGGYAYGECIIQGADLGGDATLSSESSSASSSPLFRGKIKIPFKNENIAALKMRSDGQEEQQEDVLAIAPDLVTIIDAQNGEAIGTPEYRYGLLVVVLGLTASDKWTSSERGIKLGGPEGFGFGHLNYEPLGQFVKPRSVIDEFDGDE